MAQLHPLTVLIELHFPGLGLKAILRALLDLGCIRCLVNLALVEKLGIQLRRLKVPIAFCQLDDSVVGGIPEMFRRPQLHSGTGDGETTHSRAGLTEKVESVWELEKEITEIQDRQPASKPEGDSSKPLSAL